MKYEGKFENHVSGTLETALGKVKLNVGGKGLVESQSSWKPEEAGGGLAAAHRRCPGEVMGVLLGMLT